MHILSVVAKQHVAFRKGNFISLDRVSFNFTLIYRRPRSRFLIQHRIKYDKLCRSVNNANFNRERPDSDLLFLPQVTPTAKAEKAKERFSIFTFSRPYKLLINPAVNIFFSLKSPYNIQYSSRFYFKAIFLLTSMSC